MKVTNDYSNFYGKIVVNSACICITKPKDPLKELVPYRCRSKTGLYEY